MKRRFKVVIYVYLVGLLLVLKSSLLNEHLALHIFFFSRFVVFFVVVEVAAKVASIARTHLNILIINSFFVCSR